jgi:hypothetical protein
MSDHVFQMLFSCIMYTWLELLTSHDMHVVKVYFNFQLKSQLYVVLQFVPNPRVPPPAQPQT